MRAWLPHLPDMFRFEVTLRSRSLKIWDALWASCLWHHSFLSSQAPLRLVASHLPFLGRCMSSLPSFSEHAYFPVFSLRLPNKPLPRTGLGRPNLTSSFLFSVSEAPQVTHGIPSASPALPCEFQRVRCFFGGMGWLSLWIFLVTRSCYLNFPHSSEVHPISTNPAPCSCGRHVL